MDNEITYGQASIRVLIQRFYDATISPEEMATLLAAASCPEKYVTDGGDAQLAADLSLIASLAPASQTVLESDIPAGLEQRLGRHISQLARKPSAKRRWLYSISAAAAVAALLSIGIKVTVTQPSLPTQYAATVAGTPAPAAPAAEYNGSEQPVRETTPAPATAHPARISRETMKMVKPEPQEHKIPDRIEGNTELPPIGEALASLGKMPSASDLVADVTPTLSVAAVDPVWILAQPLSTLSQSVDNVYESLDIVAKALSGVHASITSAAEGLAPVADLPLHSI